MCLSHASSRFDRRGHRTVFEPRGHVGVDGRAGDVGHLLGREEGRQVLLDSPFELRRVPTVRLVVVDQVVARFVVAQTSHLRDDGHALGGVTFLETE